MLTKQCMITLIVEWKGWDTLITSHKLCIYVSVELSFNKVVFKGYFNVHIMMYLLVFCVTSREFNEQHFISQSISKMVGEIGKGKQNCSLCTMQYNNVYEHNLLPFSHMSYNWSLVFLFNKAVNSSQIICVVRGKNCTHSPF